MKITKQIEGLDYSAERWQLYDIKTGADGCARRLNDKFTELVNAGKDRNAVEREMQDFMMQSENSKFGSADSEPFYVLESLLRKVFGE